MYGLIILSRNYLVNYSERWFADIQLSLSLALKRVKYNVQMVIILKIF